MENEYKLYEITFNSTWLGEARSRNDKKLKAEFEKVKTTKMSGRDEEEAIGYLKTEYVRLNVLSVKLLES